MTLFLLIWLGLVLIRPQDYPQLSDLGIPILPITMLAALGFWFLSPERRKLDQPTHLLFAIFIVIGMASMVANSWAGGALVRLQDMLPSMAALILVSQASYTLHSARRVMWLVCLAGVVLAIHGIEQVELGHGWTGMPTVEDGRIQYVGIFSDPNDLSMLFIMGIPMALLMSSFGGAMGIRRLFWWAVAATLLYGVYLTDSRGAFLAVMAMAGLWIWQRRGLVTAGILGAAGVSVLMMLPTRMQELDASESSAYGRIETWYDGIQMFIENPVIGVGVGMFTEHTALTAHNSFVLVLAETGIIGYTVWLAMVAYCFLMPIAVLRRPRELDPGLEEYQPFWDAERRHAMTLLVALVGFFACAFFLSRSYVILLYILLGMVTGWYGGAQERWPDLPRFDPKSHWFKWCVISVASAIGLWLVVKVLFVLAGA